MNFKKSTRSVMIVSCLIAISFFSFLNTAFESKTVELTDLKPGAIRQHRSAPVLEGQLENALKFAEELNNHINSTYTGLSMVAFRENKETGVVLHFFIDFETQKSFNDFMAQLEEDEEFSDISIKGRTLFEMPTDKLLHSIY